MEKISDSLTLHNGLKIPGLGFGVWQISPFHTAKCVKTAIKAGYRNIDTADVFDFSLSEEDMAAIDRIPYCGGMMFDPDSARS